MSVLASLAQADGDPPTVVALIFMSIMVVGGFSS